MTDTERNEINATIARAMGLTEDDWQSRCIVDQHVREGGWCNDCNALIAHAEFIPPDFTRDAAASRECVLWMSKRGADMWGKFSAFILAEQMIPELHEIANWEDVTLAAMTADLETIAQAAFQAIGGKGK